MSDEQREGSKVDYDNSQMCSPKTENKRILPVDYESDEYENVQSNAMSKRMKFSEDTSFSKKRTTVQLHPEYSLVQKNESSSSSVSVVNNISQLCPSHSGFFPQTEKNTEKIFIWDLDETIIIFHSLLTGTFAERYSKVPEKIVELGYRMEELIFKLADSYLFFNEIEDCDQVHINDLIDNDDGRDLSMYSFATDGFQLESKIMLGMASEDKHYSTNEENIKHEWLKKLAFRYRKIRRTFIDNRTSVEELLGAERGKDWLQLRAEIELMTDNWLQIALKCLSHIKSKAGYVNVLVTTTQLIPAIAKVLLFGLSDVFDIEDIYSATKVGKEACFRRILSKFGSQCTYVVIGDGVEEEKAAKQVKSLLTK